MNLFKFLKSTVGKVNVGGLVGVGGTVLLAGITLNSYLADSPAQEQKQIRSLAGIMNSGGQLPSGYENMDGLISRGGVEFASADEISRRNGILYDGGEEALGNLGSLDGRVRGYGLGAGENGLGMGGNAAADLSGGAGVEGGNPSVDGIVSRAQAAIGRAAAQAGEGTGDGEKGPTLQKASISRSGGSNLNTNIPNVRGGAARHAPRVEGTNIPSTPYNFSGSMGEGSTLVAAGDNLRGARLASSGFIAGGREGTVGRGRHSKEGKTLDDIARGSAKVAANKYRAANEGTSPFMADTTLSGGITVSGEGVVSEGSSSASFEDDMDKKVRLGKANIDQINTKEAERKAHRSRIVQLMVGSVFVTIAAMIGIAAVRNIPIWGYVIAAAIAAVALAVIAIFVAQAAIYIKKYGSDGLSIASLIVGPLLAGGIAISFLAPVAQWINGAMKTVSSKLGLSMLTNTVIGTGVSQGLEGTKAAIKDMSSDGGMGNE